MTRPTRLIALLNALTHGDLDALGAKLAEAHGACEALGHEEVAAIVAEARGALLGGDLKTYRKKVETAVAKLGHLR
jgi:glyoxylase-like metal-dependent hydrolase (beta-lactamase superfamily II)